MQYKLVPPFIFYIVLGQLHIFLHSFFAFLKNTVLVKVIQKRNLEICNLLQKILFGWSSSDKLILKFEISYKTLHCMILLFPLWSPNAGLRKKVKYTGYIFLLIIKTTRLSIYKKRESGDGKCVIILYPIIFKKIIHSWHAIISSGSTFQLIYEPA